MGESIETRITLLVDNVAGPGLLSELGFAAWIEVAGRRVLFDTGQGSALTGNAGTLGLDLRTVDTLALSHGHYDHTGGVPLVVSGSPSVEIHVHPAATGPRYCIRNGSARPIAMLEASRAALEMHSAHVRWTTHPEQLLPGVGLTGSIPRTTAYEDTGGPFFIDAGGHEPDPIADDQALWICTERGLVVVVGCSHAGLVNTLRHAVTSSGEPRLHAVIGGFHLNEASEQRLACTTDALLELCPDLIVPCHCTGDAAVAKLRRTFGDKIIQGSAGATFRFGIRSAIRPLRTPSQGTA